MARMTAVPVVTRFLQLAGWLTGWAFLVVGAWAAEPFQEKPAPPGEPSILQGRVLNVYSTERPVNPNQADKLFALEVRVTKGPVGDKNGTIKLVGKTIFVKTWQVAKRPPNWMGPKGQEEIPVRGDLVEFHMNGGPAIFEALVPVGICILAPGSYSSKVGGVEMLLMDPGEFLMGSPAQEPNRRADESQHKIRITRAFFLGAREITQDQYERVMGANPSAFSAGGTSKETVAGLVTRRFPVERVSWFDAVTFCNKVSQGEGLNPYYKITDVKLNGGAIVAANVVVLGGGGYRLPTEAEWEYACRAGTISPFHYGDESSAKTSNVRAVLDPGGYGGIPRWRDLGRPSEVGSYPPNAWALLDMHGNVAEWCEDWYDKNYYNTSPTEDPAGPGKGMHKVLRGGSWMVKDSNARSASRLFLVPGEQSFYGGFRIARTP